MESWLNNIVPNLDRHLLLRVLEFAETRDGVKVNKALKQAADTTARFELLERVNAGDDKKLSEIDTRKKRFTKQHDESKSKVAKVVEAFFTAASEEEGAFPYKAKYTYLEMEEKKKNGEVNAAALTELGIDKKMVEELYTVGHQFYQLGQAKEAAAFLHLYNDIGGAEGERESSVVWGMFAADQLAGNWGSCVHDIDAVRQLLDNSGNTTVVGRVWLLHWSLFTYFKAPHKASLMIDHVFSYPFTYLNVVECGAPHLLRYLAAACILTRRRIALRRLARVLEQSATEYSDAFTKFVDALVNHSHFEDASDLIKELKDIADNDYFLADLSDDLVVNAKKLVFEDYIRVHKTISINYVAERVGMNNHETELWLANLIREAKIDAKIDSVNAMVYVTTTKSSVYQRVLEKLESVDRPTL